MATAHQWGLSVLGACESLCHWRGTVEDMAKAGELGLIIVADVEQVNMFGNAEWQSIHQSIDRNLDELATWTDWVHQRPVEVLLPSGETVLTNRGAG